jgi:hypothetical protein
MRVLFPAWIGPQLVNPFRRRLDNRLSEQRRLVPRTLWLPGWIAGLPFLKPMFQICDCIFSHGGKSLLKRNGVIE